MIEKLYKVWFQNEGVKIDVAPDDDGLDLVQISTTDKFSKEFFGEHRLVLQPEYARELANAILACAKDCEDSQKEGNA